MKKFLLIILAGLLLLSYATGDASNKFSSDGSSLTTIMINSVDIRDGKDHVIYFIPKDEGVGCLIGNFIGMEYT